MRSRIRSRSNSAKLWVRAAILNDASAVGVPRASWICSGLARHHRRDRVVPQGIDVRFARHHGIRSRLPRCGQYQHDPCRYDGGLDDIPHAAPGTVPRARESSFHGRATYFVPSLAEYRFSSDINLAAAFGARTPVVTMSRFSSFLP